MRRVLFFADLPDLPGLPFAIAGGLAFVIICGLLVSFAVLLAGVIQRRRRRFEEDRKKS